MVYDMASKPCQVQLSPGATLSISLQIDSLDTFKVEAFVWLHSRSISDLKPLLLWNMFEQAMNPAGGCRQLHLFSSDYLIDEAMPAYVQAQNPTILEFLSRCAPPMLLQWLD